MALSILMLPWWCSLLSTILLASSGVKGDCDYPAIFSFGDSLTDTGNAVRASPTFLTSILPPYGETYFHKPFQRFNDGRLIIDFVARAMGLPFLNPYLALNENGLDFSNGVNYAVAGGTVQSSMYLVKQGGIPALTADSLTTKQLLWHQQIKSLASNASYTGAKLPSPESFSKGLYFIWIGGNDYGSVAIGKNIHAGNSTRFPFSNEQELTLVPKVVQALVDSIETLYTNDARHFLLLNVGPTGCSPLFYDFLNGTPDNLGCLTELNEIADAHNKMFFDAVESLRNKYADIDIMYGDFYNVYKDVLINPGPYGFTNTLDACCGAGERGRRQFRLRSICSPLTYKCPNPSSYVVWDGIHNTDAFNAYAMRRFIQGNNITPSNALACASPDWDR